MMSSSGERTDWSYSTAAVPTLSKNGQKNMTTTGRAKYGKTLSLVPEKQDVNLTGAVLRCYY